MHREWDVAPEPPPQGSPCVLRGLLGLGYSLEHFPAKGSRGYFRSSELGDACSDGCGASLTLMLGSFTTATGTVGRAPETVPGT